MTTESTEAVTPQKHMGKRIKDFSPEELKQYNTAMRRASRAREKEAKAAAPDADDYIIPKAQEEQLRSHHASVLAQVTSELGELSQGDDYIIDGLARCSHALTNNWTKAVQNPSGILAGHYFPDAIAHEAVDHIRNHQTRLLQSPTFATLYRDFLAQVIEFFKSEKNQKHQTNEFIEEVRAELGRLHGEA
jgi:hypothetical protein